MYGIIDFEGNLNNGDLASKFGIKLENAEENPIGFYIFSDNVVAIENLIISFDGFIYNFDQLNSLLDKTIDKINQDNLENIQNNEITLSKIFKFPFKVKSWSPFLIRIILFFHASSVVIIFIINCKIYVQTFKFSTVFRKKILSERCYCTILFCYSDNTAVFNDIIFFRVT